MCKLFSKYEGQIKSYCDENGLDFEKLSSFPQCWGKNDIWVQYHDPLKGKSGMKDETPAPIVLIISINGGNVTFTQTEHTGKYLR